MTINNKKVIKLGTRASILALWQANEVKNALEKHGFDVEILPIITKGDRILDVSLSKIGSKGVFTEELEQQLRNQTVDIVVHSSKDMPSVIDQDLKLIAFSKREKADDVIVGRKKISDEIIKQLHTNNKTIKIGTSSSRRVALLKKYYPNTEVVQMRGNLQTRIKKMYNGDCDYLMLAHAGIIRLKQEHLIQQKLPIQIFTPPAGQGSIVIQTHNSIDDSLKQEIRTAYNDTETENCILAERIFLKHFNGGCSIPIFVHANMNQDNNMEINGGIISLDGTNIVRAKTVINDMSNLSKHTISLAQEVSDKGGKEILQKIKQQSL